MNLDNKIICPACWKIAFWNSTFRGWLCECGNIKRKPATNADRIKETNRALAEKLTDCTYRKDFSFARPSWADPYGNSYLTREDAVSEWLEWLEQPVKEDSNNSDMQ